MATITVTSLSDDDPVGGVSLREAIVTANSLPGADEIVFSEDLAGTITLQGGRLRITESLTIDGGGVVTVDGGGTTGVFSVLPGDADVVVDLAGMTVRDGQAASGGGLFIGTGIGGAIADVALIDMSFIGNVAAGGDAGQGGGAIFMAGGILTVDDTSFGGNAATGGNGAGGHVLVASGSADFDGALFLDGTARDAGGAIAFRGGGTLVVTDSILGDNAATGATGEGGAIHATGSGLVSLGRVTLLDNAAGEGGALWLGFGTDLFASGARFDGNTVREGGDGLGGGAIFSIGGDLEIADVAFLDNQVLQAGGAGGHILILDGLLDVAGGIFQGGFAGEGGAIQGIDADVVITGTTFAENATLGDGGAIALAGSTFLDVARAIFSENSAFLEGGAISLGAQAELVVRGGAFLRNDAEDGAAIGSNGGAVSLLADADGGPVLFFGNGSGGNVVTVSGSGPLLAEAIELGAGQRLRGSDGDDDLTGGSGDDVLNGAGGDDILSGGGGLNVLTGAGGADAFVFLDGTGGRSVVADFSDGDVLIFDDQLFGLGGEGFNPRGVPQDIADAAIAQGLFRYDRSTGEIVTDADGFGGDAGQVVAVLANRPGLSVDDVLLL